MGPDKEDNRGKGAASIPRGIEILVKKASVDPAFRAILLERRAKAADEIGLTLDPAEAAMLDSIPAEQLQAIIDKTKVDAAQRNVFLGKVAVVMLAALTAGAAMTTYVGCQSKGNRPDVPHGIRADRPAATAPSQPGTQPGTQPATGPHTETPRKDGP